MCNWKVINGLHALLLGCPSVLFCCSTATAIVTYSIGNLDLLSFSNSNVTLIVDSATAGNQPIVASNSSSTYSITCNGTARKIYGSYAPILSGPVLSAMLTAPEGAQSLGAVALSDQPTPLVTGIANVSAKNLPITYLLMASVANAPSVHQVTVTYTVAP
jgi:hypothetical protein